MNIFFGLPSPKFMAFFCATFVMLLQHKTDLPAPDKAGLNTNQLPNVFDQDQPNAVGNLLQKQAASAFATHHLPRTKADWEAYSIKLKQELIKKTGALVNQHLPLNITETGNIKMNGYSIKNIAFQSRPGIMATANLYVPDGNGKFPASVVMMGHSPNGRFYDKYQDVGITLAQNGYVALCIDPWGSGERTTYDSQFEDHGDDNNLGISLIDIGESLMGMQITDNIRAVDVLSSLSYVDAEKIGATGSSGGGNQTIWLTVMDKRIKAAVPVVSAGTYQAFVMGSPCICEILPDGLTFTEEAGVLSLIAPRPIKMCNHTRDANAAFQPKEMLRTFNNARPIFNLYGAANKISYQVFDLTHGYYPEDREAMIKWFDFYLKGGDSTKAIKIDSLKNLAVEQLAVYAKGKRDSAVKSTADYCIEKGKALRKIYLSKASINGPAKTAELKKLLKINSATTAIKTKEYPEKDGWKRFALTTDEGKLIPLIIKNPTAKNTKQFVIVTSPIGKQDISSELIDSIISSGSGIAIPDLSGTGETASAAIHSDDSVGRLRTYSKSCLLLGKTVMGEWVKELQAVTNFLRNNYHPLSISMYGTKESGLASLFLAAIDKHIDLVSLNNAPVSYLFDNRDSIEYFSTAIHVPGVLNYGDLSLIAALTGKKVQFNNPVTMSGRKITGDELIQSISEYNRAKKICRN